MWEVQSVRYSEFCALSSDRFAGEVIYAVFQQSRWAWKLPSNTTELIQVITTRVNVEALEGIRNLGDSWSIFVQLLL